MRARYGRHKTIWHGRGGAFDLYCGGQSRVPCILSVGDFQRISLSGLRHEQGERLFSGGQMGAGVAAESGGVSGDGGGSLFWRKPLSAREEGKRAQVAHRSSVCVAVGGILPPHVLVFSGPGSVCLYEG